MNSKMDQQIIDFMNSVGKYLSMEYHPKYTETFFRKEIVNGLYEFIGSYYMGGSTVPDTARYVVEYIERFVWSKDD